jgi:hypothetical protein
MKFQVGRFICELSRDVSGEVKVEWQPRQPLYLNQVERRQYQAGRAAFLGQPSNIGAAGDRAATVKSHTSAFLAIAIVALLTGCARGGGIGLEAMLADHNCEQAGYQLGTPEYANCRMALHQQSAINAAAMQAYYQRQQDYYMQQLNRGQTCSYNGSTIGGMTNGTMTCR